MTKKKSVPTISLTLPQQDDINRFVQAQQLAPSPSPSPLPTPSVPGYTLTTTLGRAVQIGAGIAALYGILYWCGVAPPRAPSTKDTSTVSFSSLSSPVYERKPVLPEQPDPDGLKYELIGVIDPDGSCKKYKIQQPDVHSNLNEIIAHAYNNKHPYGALRLLLKRVDANKDHKVTMGECSAYRAYINTFPERERWNRAREDIERAGKE